MAKTAGLDFRASPKLISGTDQKIVIATSTLAGDLFSEVHQIETIININLAKMPNLKW